MDLLTEKEWAGVYRSGDQNLFKDFYTPALKTAVKYDRAVGFFSSEALVSNLQGISGLIKNDGKMRLIIGHPLDEQEFDAVKQGYRMQSLVASFQEKLSSILENLETKDGTRLSLLSYLIAANRLEIKFALRKRGMYHEKIGVVYDAQGNSLVFHGSANETVYALDAGFNAESISVFRSWDQHSFDLYGKSYVEGFELLWQGNQKNTVTIDVPSTFYETISKKFPPSEDGKTQFEEPSYEDEYEAFFGAEDSFNRPRVPASIGGSALSIRDHQKQAIRSWAQNQYKGILKLSTGSGKTITSIFS